MLKKKLTRKYPEKRRRRDPKGREDGVEGEGRRKERALGVERGALQERKKKGG